MSSRCGFGGNSFEKGDKKYEKTFDPSDYDCFEIAREVSTSFETEDGLKVFYFHRFHRETYCRDPLYYWGNYFSKSFKNQVLLKVEPFSLKVMFVSKIVDFVMFQYDSTGLEVFVILVPQLQKGVVNSCLEEVLEDVKEVRICIITLFFVIYSIHLILSYDHHIFDSRNAT